MVARDPRGRLGSVWHPLGGLQWHAETAQPGADSKGTWRSHGRLGAIRSRSAQSEDRPTPPWYARGKHGRWRSTWRTVVWAQTVLTPWSSPISGGCASLPGYHAAAFRAGVHLSLLMQSQSSMGHAALGWRAPWRVSVRFGPCPIAGVPPSEAWTSPRLPPHHVRPHREHGRSPSSPGRASWRSPSWSPGDWPPTSSLTSPTGTSVSSAAASRLSPPRAGVGSRRRS